MSEDDRAGQTKDSKRKGKVEEKNLTNTVLMLRRPDLAPTKTPADISLSLP